MTCSTSCDYAIGRHVCRFLFHVAVPQGHGSPSSPGTHVIHYIITSGIQKLYHYHRGQAHGSAYRTAFVPATHEGWSLVQRLQCAFERGETFTVGKSLTGDQHDFVIWASMPHKAAYYGARTIWLSSPRRHCRLQPEAG
jgi:hypothetical protein